MSLTDLRRPRVAFYDWMEYDDADLYGTLADITRCNRWRPQPKVAANADLILTTYSRTPQTSGLPVVLVSSALEVVVGLPVVYRARHWTTHAVAAYCAKALLEHADLGRPVLVVGFGPIARLLNRWLRRYWPGLMQNRPGAVVVLTSARDEDAAARVSLAVMAMGAGGTLVHVARGHPVAASQMRAYFDLGYVDHLVIDVETHSTAWADVAEVYGQRVTRTAHTAWRGHRSQARRQAAVMEALRLATYGRLDKLLLVRP